MSSGVAAPSRRTRDIIEDVAARMSAELDDSSTLVTDAIHEHVGDLEDDLYLATRESTRANIRLINALVARGADPTAFTAPEEALAYARSYVHAGLGLDCLTRVYREGEQAYRKLWLRHIHDRANDADELAEALGYFSDYLFTYIGAIDQPLSAAYTAEHERWVRGGIAMRSEEVRSILAGAHVNVTEASTRLRYRLEGRHVGFVIWNDAPESEDVTIDDGRRLFGEMDRFAGEVAAGLGATGMLSLPIARYHAGWAAVSEEPDISAVPRDRDGLRVAVGRLGRGVEGFRRSHQEALLARRVASLSERSSIACASFGSLALDALLTQDIGEARRFVMHELGPLTDGSDASRRLSATLEVFLQEESSFVRTGRRLHIHENTVAYRIRRVEELLGHRVSERQLELRAALRVARFVQEDAAAHPAE